VRRNVLALHDLIRLTIGAARELAAAANAAVPEAGLERRRQDGAHREREIQLQRDREALQDFLSEQARLAGRTREQIALEAELQAVQRAARGEGITLTREQAEAQARLNLQLRGEASPAGGGRGGRADTQDDFARAVAAIRERTAALELEAVALVSAAGSGREYGEAIMFAYERARLLTAAQRDGLAITPELEAAVDSLADAYVRAGQAAEDAANQLRDMEDHAQRGARAMTDLFMGIMQGGDAAKRAIAQLLMELARVQMMKAMLGLAKGGGPLGNMILGLGRALSGFAEGGYTGNGGKHEPAGVVHKGEYVFSKKAVQRIGVGNLEAMHSAAKGYASGGLVGSAPMSETRAQVTVNIDARGAVEGVADQVRRAVVELAPELERRAVAAVGQAQRRGYRA